MSFSPGLYEHRWGTFRKAFQYILERTQIWNGFFIGLLNRKCVAIAVNLVGVGCRGLVGMGPSHMWSSNIHFRSNTSPSNSERILWDGLGCALKENIEYFIMLDILLHLYEDVCGNIYVCHHSLRLWGLPDLKCVRFAIQTIWESMNVLS